MLPHILALLQVDGGAVCYITTSSCIQWCVWWHGILVDWSKHFEETINLGSGGLVAVAAL